MERFVYLNNLYDFYKELFTEKQKEYFEDYYWNNLSLGEIADNCGVSRNAVHNQLKIMEERLDEIESKLKLYEKRNEIISLLNDKIDDELLERIKNLL